MTNTATDTRRKQILAGLNRLDLQRCGLVTSPTPGPWQFETGGGAYALGCDAWTFVAVPREWVDGELPAPPEFVAKVADRWIAMTSEPTAVVISASDLASFVRLDALPADCRECKNARTVECEECKGSGDVDCTCECGDSHSAQCDDCEGRGKVPCEACDADVDRPVQCLGNVINATRLRDALAAIRPSGDVCLSFQTIPRGPGKPISHGYLLRSADDAQCWMALVMPMAPHVKTVEVFPVAQPPSVDAVAAPVESATPPQFAQKDL